MYIKMVPWIQVRPAAPARPAPPSFRSNRARWSTRSRTAGRAERTAAGMAGRTAGKKVKAGGKVGRIVNGRARFDGRRRRDGRRGTGWRSGSGWIRPRLHTDIFIVSFFFENYQFRKLVAEFWNKNCYIILKVQVFLNLFIFLWCY